VLGKSPSSSRGPSHPDLGKSEPELLREVSQLREVYAAEQQELTRVGGAGGGGGWGCLCSAVCGACLPLCDDVMPGDQEQQGRGSLGSSEGSEPPMLALMP
jgi:hypothetical protein